jgi:glycosyltransferase involved in cell wall biosynthesis
LFLLVQRKLSIQGLTCEHIIITGVDATMFHPRKRRPEVRHELTFGDPDGFLCVYCGRISREKQLDTIISAVKAIPHAYLAIVGDGPMAAHYAELHGPDDRLYCRPRFLDHHELAEVS